jgi:hypothetical protein
LADLELGNMAFNTNANQLYNCPEYIVALLKMIDSELQRIMYNIHQEPYDSPFKNTGNRFALGNFEIEAYSWNDDYDQEYNFIYKVDKTRANRNDIKISWYKYLGRDTTINQELDSSILIHMFDDVMRQLRNYEEEELQKEEPSIY